MGGRQSRLNRQAQDDQSVKADRPTNEETKLPTTNSEGDVSRRIATLWSYATHPDLPHLPKFVKDSKFGLVDLELQVRQIYRVFKVLENEWFSHFPAHFAKLDQYGSSLKFDGIPWLIAPIPTPELVSKWRLDTTFAAQYIIGANPVLITRAAATGPRALPSILTSSSSNIDRINTYLATVENKPNYTLDTLISEQRLYFVDYHILDGVKAKNGTSYVIYAPIVLLYDSASQSTLMPLAVQLERTSGGENEVFLPPLSTNTDQADQRTWLFAKIHTNHADALMHQVATHLIATHLSMEPMIIASHRRFNNKHPIFLLLQEHFHGTIAINNLGRKALFSDPAHLNMVDREVNRMFVGSADQSFFDIVVSTGLVNSLKFGAKFYRTQWALDTLPVPKALEKRGFSVQNDPLLHYGYREDAVRIWGAIESFCKETIYALYASDQAIIDDHEVQGWLSEMKSEDGGNIPGVPSVTTRDDLTEVLAAIIFNASAQHSALNYGQYEWYSTQCFRPASLLKGMPPANDRATAFASDDYILQALPNGQQTKLLIKFAYSLTLPTSDPLEIEGWEKNPKLYSIENDHEHPGVLEAFKNFQNHLRVIREEIVARNKASSHPYTYLIPNQIPRSVAI